MSHFFASGGKDSGAVIESQAWLKRTSFLNSRSFPLNIIGPRFGGLPLVPGRSRELERKSAKDLAQ